jgi:hypothetical protein
MYRYSYVDDFRGFDWHKKGTGGADGNFIYGLEFAMTSISNFKFMVDGSLLQNKMTRFGSFEDLSGSFPVSISNRANFKLRRAR